VPSDVDERPRPGETVRQLVRRLGEAKARRVAERHPGHLVIGSDQSVSLSPHGDAGAALGKPGTLAAARAQLASLSGRQVSFLTSLCVIDARHADPDADPDAAADATFDHASITHDIDRTVVTLRTLQADEIARYVARDDALDCAGAFRVESLGIALFERIDSQDPTALTGLPLIRLAARLRAAGLAVP